jgi:hypothetical protein
MSSALLHDEVLINIFKPEAKKANKMKAKVKMKLRK